MPRFQPADAFFDGPEPIFQGPVPGPVSAPGHYGLPWDDPHGDRRFFYSPEPLALQCGGELPDFTIAYETWGRLNAARDNVIVVCHALTGDSHCDGEQGPGHPTPGWWPGMVGAGLPLDTDDWFVVCTNVLGGCRGTTGPSSLYPKTGIRWGLDFPLVTVRDMVRAQKRLLDDLGVTSVALVTGGSLGGEQALEWGVLYPEFVRSIAPIAASLAASPLQIAFNSSGRRAIVLDPAFEGGQYYDSGEGWGPTRGLAVGRMIAHTTYRSDESLDQRFGRELVGGAPSSLFQRFEVESYLDYHGQKLVRRFDANSYLYLTKAMDLHDLSLGRDSMDAAVAALTMPVLSIGVRSDILFPVHQQREIVDAVRAAGGTAGYVEIDSPHGHDGFLIETDQVGGAIADFLEDPAAVSGR